MSTSASSAASAADRQTAHMAATQTIDRADLAALCRRIYLRRGPASVPHFGELALGFHQHLGRRFWHDSDGEMKAAAMLLPGSGLELIVDTDSSQLIIEALDWGQQAASGSLVVPIRGRNPALAQALWRRGYSFDPSYEIVVLTRDIAEVPKSESEFRVQSLGQRHLPRKLSTHRLVWEPWAAAEVSREQYVALQNFFGYDPDLDILVEVDGLVAAYANFWLDDSCGWASLSLLGTLAEYRRRGMARALVLEGLRRLAARKARRVSIQILRTNQPAMKLYTSLGFREAGRTRLMVGPDSDRP